MLKNLGCKLKAAYELLLCLLSTDDNQCVPALIRSMRYALSGIEQPAAIPGHRLWGLIIESGQAQERLQDRPSEIHVLQSDTPSHIRHKLLLCYKKSLRALQQRQPQNPYLEVGMPDLISHSDSYLWPIRGGNSCDSPAGLPNVPGRVIICITNACNNGFDFNLGSAPRASKHITMTSKCQ